MRNEEEITVITHPVFDYRLPHHVLELLNEWEKLAPKNTFFIHTHTQKRCRIIPVEKSTMPRQWS